MQDGCEFSHEVGNSSSNSSNSNSSSSSSISSSSRLSDMRMGGASLLLFFVGLYACMLQYSLLTTTASLALGIGSRSHAVTRIISSQSTMKAPSGGIIINANQLPWKRSIMKLKAASFWDAA